MHHPKRPCVYALYVPGGGVYGLMPLVMLERLNQLTGIPTANIFPVQEGVSTGAIVIAGLNIPDAQGNPKYTEEQAIDKFIENASEFFPPMPGRGRRLAVFNTLSRMRKNMDPRETSKFLIIGAIRSAAKIKQLAKTAGTGAQNLDDDDLGILNEIKDRSKKRWISWSDIRFISKQTKILSDKTDIDEIKDELKHINDFAVNRRTHGGLKGVFHRACFYGVNCLRNAHSHNIHFDPEIPKRAFQEHFGDATIADLISSVYISTYDYRNEEKLTFYSRKRNPFDTSPDAPRSNSRLMPKTWDAVMASISSGLAYPAHRMENGLPTEDWAPIHNPQKSVDTTIDNLPEDVDFKLVIMGTGDNKIPYRADHGIIGHLQEGRTLRDMHKYTNSDFRKKLLKRFGPDSIIEFNPRLAPRTMEEHKNFPTKDILDASHEQMERIIARTREYLAKEDTDRQLKTLAVDLVENMHMTGQVTREHVNAVRRRCGMEPIANDNAQTAQGFSKWFRNIVPSIF